MSDPIRAVTKIKNNRLLEYRESQGLTAKQFAAKIGIGYARYLQFEGLYRYPSTKMIMKISDATLCDPEFLFPEYLKAITRAVSVRTIPEAEVLSLTGAPDNLAITDGSEIERATLMGELKESIEDTLCTMPKSYQRAITLHFGLDNNGERTADEIGQLMGCSPATARYWVSRGLRMLRYPPRSRNLKPFNE